MYCFMNYIDLQTLYIYKYGFGSVQTRNFQIIKEKDYLPRL